MWISTKAQYGLRALIEIALGNEAPTTLKAVAEKQGISQPYLEQIAGSLRRSGFIRSVRGAHGGYKLARPASEITAWEVVQAMEGSLAPVNCIEGPELCGHTGDCATESLWRRVDLAIRSVLSATTLADLTHEAEFLEGAKRVRTLSTLSPTA